MPLDVVGQRCVSERELGLGLVANVEGARIRVSFPATGDKASVVALCSPAAIKGGKQAGKIVGERCAQLGGKGGGKPDFAMGGGKDTAKLAEVLAG